MKKEKNSTSCEKTENTEAVTSPIRYEKLFELSEKVLHILNVARLPSNVMELIAQSIQQKTGIQAIGVRLKDNKDFHYVASHGFPKEFLQAENSLIAHNANGEFCLDKDGNVSLECTCGLVISGKLDSGNHDVSAGGSFWTNDAISCAKDCLAHDDRLNPRNRCLHDGYRSVALIPIRADQEIVGLLQLNDKRPGCFSQELVRYFEGLTNSLGVSMLRLREEEALLKSQRLQHEAQHIARIGNWEWNLRTGEVHWSAEIYTMSGMQPDSRALTPDTLLKLVHPDDAGKVKRIIAKAIADGTPADLEYRIVLGDGSIRVIHAIGAVAEFDGEGKPYLMLGTNQDITERKQAEAALRESEDSFRMLIDSAPDGIFVQAEGRILYINPAVLNMFGGKQPEEIEGTELTRWIAPEFRDKVRERIMMQKNTGRPVPPMEQEYLRLDGTRFPVETTASPIRFMGQEAHLVFIRDITERKRVEKEREALTHQRQLALNAAHLGWWHYDPVTKIASWDDRYAKIFGVTGHERSNEEILKLLHADDLARVLSAVEAALNPNDTRQYAEEYRVIRADGSMRWIKAHGMAEFAGDGIARHAVSFVGTVEDITERKQAEAEKATLQAQFLQAQKMETIGRLAGGIAHDFNNLLMGIMGYADICKQKLGKDNPHCSYLDHIINAAGRSAGITRQLLSFARQDTILPRILNLNEHISSTIKLLRRLIGEDIDLCWAPDAQCSIVKMDPSQVDQVLANLVVNARDAIAGVGKVTIQTGNVIFDSEFCKQNVWAKPGDYVVLHVSDTGCGMAPEIMARIFEPFFTTKPVGKGTGLGLATVYGIMEQNEGCIGVTSKIGIGTTFNIYFKRHVGVQNEEKTCVPQHLQGGTETIMIVEDDADVREITTLFLQSLGYDVISAATPEEALRISGEGKKMIQLLLTDVIMPGINGKELSTKLTLRHPGIKTLFISGYSSDIIAKDGILHGETNLLVKPFTRKDIAMKIRQMLNNQNR